MLIYYVLLVFGFWFIVYLYLIILLLLTYNYKIVEWWKELIWDFILNVLYILPVNNNLLSTVVEKQNSQLKISHE